MKPGFTVIRSEFVTVEATEKEAEAFFEAVFSEEKFKNEST